MQVYLDGRVLPLAEARISPDDRGFLFADGLYEGVAAYHGRLFCWREHMERLAAGLRALEIPFSGFDELEAAAHDLLDANDLRGGDALIYLQVTRGAAPRAHAFPEPAPSPTVYLTARATGRRSPEEIARGVAAVTLPDTRWARCDLKTTALVANVLAHQEAHRRGAFEALLVRDGVVLEGSHTNLFAVRGGVLLTFPEGPYILPGVTRGLVLEDAAALGLPVRLGPLFLAELASVEELFLTGTSTEVMPVVTVDGRTVGEGRPGPVTWRLREAFVRRVETAESGEPWQGRGGRSR